jgi:hypothetical protein
MTEPNPAQTQFPVRPFRPAPEWHWALVPVGLAVFLGTALVDYHLHQQQVTPTSAAQIAVAECYRTFGFAASFLFLSLVFAWGSVWVFTGRIERPLRRLARAALVLVTVGIVMNLGNGEGTAAPHQGELGAWLAGRLVAGIGYYASVLLVWPAALGSMLLATDYFFFDYLDGMRRHGLPTEPSGSVPAAPAEERGVEAEAAEVLKSLAQGQDSGAPVVGAVSAAGARAADDPEADAGGVDVQPAEDPFEPATYRPWRRSYRERRHAEAAESARAAAGAEPDETWEPIEPDVQEVAQAEADLAAGGAEAPAAESSPAEGAAEPIPPVSEAAPWDEHELEAAAPPSAAETLPVDLLRQELLEPREDREREDREREDRETGQAEWLGAAEAPPAEPAAPEGQPVGGSAAEPTVSIPRPEREPLPAAPGRDAARQQHLFGAAPDPALVDEAIEVVTTWRRASATFLQRRLRIDYAMACQLLAELAARGIVELEADAAHGRVRGT